MWSIAVGSFCVLFAARLLLPFIAPPEYAEAFTVTLLIMPAMALSGLFYYGETLLKAAKKSYIIGLVVVVCAVFSVLANFILINYISWYGALLASNITFLILGSSIFYIGLKEYSVPIEWGRLRIAAVLFIGVLSTNLLLLKSNLYLYCILSLAVAAPVVYFSIRGSFWDDSEKQAVQQALDKLKSLFQKTPPEHTESNIV
jgi:O-antigen/teichoic acid export membrane protein